MNRNVVYRAGWVTSTEFRRWLKKRGCTLGPKLIAKIKKDLGLR